MNAVTKTPGPELFGPVAHPVCDPDFPDDLLFEDIDSKPALVVMQFDGFPTPSNDSVGSSTTVNPCDVSV